MIMTELAHVIDDDEPQRYDTPPALITRSLSAGMNMFSGKWKLPILWYLEQRPRRFGELSSLLPGVTAKVLTCQLRELEDAGLIMRCGTHPRQPVYTLTAAGLEARPLLQLLWEWGNWHLRHEAQKTDSDV